MTTNDRGVHKYIPKAVLEGKFEGFVKMRLLTFDEYYDFLERFTETEGDESQVGKLKSTRTLVSESKSHYVEVDLKRLSDGAEFKSFDDLKYGGDCHAILIEVATGLLRSFEKGNG